MTEIQPTKRLRRAAAATRQEANEDEEYEVEAILSSKGGAKRGNKRLYLIKWKGYDHQYNTWEPAANIDKELLAQFELIQSTYIKQQEMMKEQPCKEVMIGSNTISSLLQNKKLEREYTFAMKEMQDAAHALFYTASLTQG